MSKLPPHTFRRNATIYARLKVPKRFQEQVGKQAFVASLQTDSPAIAARLVRPFIARWKHRLAQLEAEDIVEREAALWRENLELMSDEDPLQREALEGVMVDAVISKVDSGGLSETQAKAVIKGATGDTDDLVSSHIEDYISAMDLSERNQNDYRRVLKEIAKEKPLVSQWTRKVAVEYAVDLCNKHPQSTVSKYLAAPRGLWGYLYDREMVEGNPWRGIKLPKKDALKNADKRPFSDDEAALVLSQCPDNIKPLVSFLAASGVRISEALGLTTDDVTVDGDFVWIDIKEGKTDNSPRKIPVLGSWTFPLTNEPEMASDRVRNLVKRRVGLSDPAISAAHSWRHRASTKAFEAGHPETEIAAFLGHGHTNISRARYGKNAINIEAQKAIARSVAAGVS
jgi:integrase